MSAGMGCPGVGLEARRVTLALCVVVCRQGGMWGGVVAYRGHDFG